MILVESEENAKQEGPSGFCALRFQQLQSTTHTLVVSTAFDHVIMAAIALNTVCLAVTHYQQPELMTTILEFAEYAFTGLFLLEAGLKILGLGPAQYFSDAACVFDFAITVLSFVSLFKLAGNISALRTLRVFRALRIARILRRFPVVVRILEGVLGSLNTVLALAIFLLFLLLLFGVVGMHLYGNRFDKFDPKPRANFDTFWSAVIVLFQVLTGDDWETSFYDAMRVEEVPSVVTVLFFVSYFIMGNLCLLNLFIAAILQKLKISTVEPGAESQAARAALVMKEALEAEAALKDLDDAKLFLVELQASPASSAVEIAEAEQTVNDLAIVSAKESEESIQMDNTLRFFGFTSSVYALGVFGPSNPIRSSAQALVSVHWHLKHTTRI